MYSLFFQGARTRVAKCPLSSNAFKAAPVSTPLFPELFAPIHVPTALHPPTEEELSHIGHGGGHHDNIPHQGELLFGVKRDEKKVYKIEQYISTPLYNNPTLITIQKRDYSTFTTPKKKIAVVLSGCGVKDGSEIHESVSLLLHLDRAGASASCYAPDIKQTNTINHLTSQNTEEKRNVLVESARIARGDIEPLSKLKASNYDGVVFPGGFGAATNLSSFADEKEGCKVEKDVERVIKEFHAQKKPIGLCCIAPVLAVKILPASRITLGNEDKDTAKLVSNMGGLPHPASTTEIVVDEKNNIITTPAYMNKSPIYEVFVGIGKLVDAVLSRTIAKTKSA